MPGYPHEPTREDTDIIPIRIVAHLIDVVALLIFLYPFSIILAFFAKLLLPISPAVSAGFGLVVGVTLAGFHHIVLEGIWDGQTIGKNLVGIKVVQEDGAECTLSGSIIRNVVELIDALFVYAVGLISIATFEKRQRIGDRVAGTVVVAEPRTEES